MGDKIRLDETEPSDWNGERDQILSLYAQRLSVAYISQAIGRSQGFVSKVLHSEFAERSGKRQEIVLAHQQTLAWMIQKVTKRVAKADEHWDRKDLELLLKLSEREARLFGLDQPVKHEVTLEVETYTEEELIAQLNQVGYHISLPTSIKPTALPEHIPDADYTSSDTANED